MASVELLCRGEQHPVNEDFVVKRVTDVESFHAEVDALRLLRNNHRNVVCLIAEVGNVREGSFYMLMSPLAHCNLDNLPADVADDTETMQVMLTHLVDGVHYMHRKGIVHGTNIMPSNVVYSVNELDQRKFVLIDFACV